VTGVIQGADELLLYYDISLQCTLHWKINETNNQMLTGPGKISGRGGPIRFSIDCCSMQKFSDALEFEKAAALRVLINAIERVVEKQKVISTQNMITDVFAGHVRWRSCVQIFFIRCGKRWDGIILYSKAPMTRIN
jgi:excinuclease ABC subunit C